MTFTPKDYWLYQNQEYIDAYERLMEEVDALSDLMDEILFNLDAPGNRGRLAQQEARYRAARNAKREVRERLMASRAKV